MRVGLNATSLNDRPSGAKQRFIGLYRALAARRPDIDLIVFEPADCHVATWFEGLPNVHARATPLPSADRVRRTALGLRFWRGALKHEQLDLFEHFHLPLVKAPDCPTILTIHDPRSVRPEVPPLRRAIPMLVFRHAVAGADHLVTVSETMRQELRGLGAVLPITSIYNGIDPEPFGRKEPGRAKATRSQLGLSEPFLLAVGHLEERKNYARLIEAVAHLRGTGRAIGLVIVGNDAGLGNILTEQIGRCGLSKNIKLLEGIAEEQLVDLYALAEIVVFPSRYEGFGIPILEAMAARRPLVLSDIPVFRELTESRGAYFPPEDSQAMADGIARVLDSPARQAELVAYGDERVRAFGFDELARQLGNLYETVLAGS
jgi:glycosyltransferase involved in cell wall biosynthesis